MVADARNALPRSRRLGADSRGGGAAVATDAAVDLEFQLAMAIVTHSRANVLAHPMGMAVTRLELKPLRQLHELAAACRESGKAFELNTRYCSSPDDWIAVVKESGCRVSLGSDAHRTSDVGSAWRVFVLGEGGPK